ncbi:hypothetical protein DERP_006116 [Dermatophagoides pteronyssinus]|uniref:Uncharacterized protein n=1 Tax=Dermatophagoides pteronyssinus TaxID=6956 RepID=A0ABQ8JSI8_DERPT|nr:hypothetical protein DERP_006116 [Dermatophagoides pteronyssinus]
MSFGFVFAPSNSYSVKNNNNVTNENEEKREKEKKIDSCSLDSCSPSSFFSLNYHYHRHYIDVLEGSNLSATDKQTTRNELEEENIWKKNNEIPIPMMHKHYTHIHSLWKGIFDWLYWKQMNYHYNQYGNCISSESRID